MSGTTMLVLVNFTLGRDLNLNIFKIFKNSNTKKLDYPKFHKLNSNVLIAALFVEIQDATFKRKEKTTVHLNEMTVFTLHHSSRGQSYFSILISHEMGTFNWIYTDTLNYIQLQILLVFPLTILEHLLHLMAYFNNSNCGKVIASFTVLFYS